jgi:hypothetical protein
MNPSSKKLKMIANAFYKKHYATGSIIMQPVALTFFKKSET